MPINIGGVVPTNLTKFKTLQVIMPRREAQQVERYVKRRGLSVSEFLKSLLRLIDTTK